MWSQLLDSEPDNGSLLNDKKQRNKNIDGVGQYKIISDHS